MFVPAGRFSLRPKRALIDAHVAVVAQAGLDNVIQLHAVRRPGQIRRLERRGLGRTGEGPGKHPAHVVPVIVLAALLSLIEEDPLIYADVLVVAQVRLDDVVQINTRRRPLRQHRRRHGQGGNDRKQGNQNRPEASHWAAALSEKRAWSRLRGA